MQIKTIMLLGACITASYSGAMEEPNNSERQEIENSRKATPKQVINTLCAGYHCFPESDIPYLAALPRELMEVVVETIRQEINKDTVSLLNAMKFGIANEKEVKLILENRCINVNMRDTLTPYNTLLIIAVLRNFKEIAEILIQAGANPNMQNGYGHTALIRAMLTIGYDSEVKMLIDKGANLDIQDSYGHTALIKAIIEGSEERVKMLIDAGANLDIQDIGGTTALMHAACRDSIEMLKMLINAGADINVQDINGHTALDWTIVTRNNQEIVNLIRAAEEKAQSTLAE